jgi:hypothetical protein
MAKSLMPKKAIKATGHQIQAHVVVLRKSFRETLARAAANDKASLVAKSYASGSKSRVPTGPF